MSLPLTSDRPQLIVNRTVLKNGLVVLTMENPTADIVAARLFVRVGSRYEQAEQAGISHLLTSVMTKGTRHLSSMEIAEQVESVGASLGADSATDYSLMSLKTVAADFSNVLALAAEILRFPSFPEAEVDLERRLTAQGLRSMQEQPFSVAQKQLRQAMYGEHPYGRSALGTEESIQTLTRDDLQQFHQAYFRPDNMVVSIAGRISSQQAVELVEQYFGDWQPSDLASPLSPPPFASLGMIDTSPPPNSATIDRLSERFSIRQSSRSDPATDSADNVTVRTLQSSLRTMSSSRKSFNQTDSTIGGELAIQSRH